MLMRVKKQKRGKNVTMAIENIQEMGDAKILPENYKTRKARRRRLPHFWET